jgi:hypothetical protein
MATRFDGLVLSPFNGLQASRITLTSRRVFYENNPVRDPFHPIPSSSLVLKGDKLVADITAGGIPAVPVKNCAPENAYDQNLLTRSPVSNAS